MPLCYRCLRLAETSPPTPEAEVRRMASREGTCSRCRRDCADVHPDETGEPAG